MSAAKPTVTLHAQDFPIAIGTIGAKTRICQDDFTENELDAFLHNLDNFFVAVDQKGKAIPAQCVDGRSRVDGSYEPRPKAAAGTFSAVIGDALTTASYRPEGGDAAAHAKEVYAYFMRHGYVGGHDADHASQGGCGCGAEDKLKDILIYIRDHGADIQSFLKDAGVPVDRATHEHIVKQAAALLDQDYVVSGTILRDVFMSVAGKASIETLTGQHNEVALVINTVPDTTVDRATLAETYGSKFQVFELDVPSLQIAADALSVSVEEARQKFAAMLYYNVATAAVLADTSLRILVR